MASPEFLRWCEDQGVACHGVRPAVVEQGGRGIVATQDLQAGQRIMRVPERLLMSGSSAARDPALGPLLRHAATRLDNHQVLCVHLLHEAAKGPGSFWHTYIRQLPPCYHTLATWHPAAVEALQVPHAVAAAAAVRDRARRQHQEALPLMRQLGLERSWLGWRAWQWATATVSSRTMYLPGDPAGALTPLGDLHNYEPPAAPFTPSFDAPPPAAAPGAPGTQSPQGGGGGGARDEDGAAGGGGDGRFDAAAGCYDLHARRRFAAGEQVFLCYGAHTNLELLELYGFLVPNPHDRVLLPRAGLPDACCEGLPDAQRCIHADGRPTWELLRVLRRGSASPAELKANGHAAWCGQPISRASEARAATHLAAACQQLLRSLPTTLEQDQQQAAAAAREGGAGEGGGAGAGHAGEVLQLALQWRIAAKASLHACAAHCEAVAAALQGTQGRGRARGTP